MMSLQMDTRLSHKPQLFNALIFHYAVTALLLTHPHGGRSQQIGQAQPLVAVVGDDVTLPCQVKPATDAVNVMVEWSRPDLQPRFVHMRRSGEDRLIDQNPSYRERTSVSIDGLKQGDMSLRLSKVKLSDEGTYRCFVPDLNTDSSVQLVVDVIKITKFSNGVLECKYSGSYPESEVSWLDSEGNVLSAGPTETVRGPDDLFTVSSNLTVEKGHSNNFTCRVREKSTSQIRETRINVPDDFFSDPSGSSAPVIIGVFVAIMVILAVVFGVWKWRQHKIKTGSDHTDEEKSTEPERQSLMNAGTDIEKTGKMKNQDKMKERNNTAPPTEETGLPCQVVDKTQPVKLGTKGESDNDVIQKQSADAGTGSQSVMEEGGREHEVQKGDETINDLDNTEKGTKSMSEETQTEDNENIRTSEEDSKSSIPGTDDGGVTDGDGHRENEARGEAMTDHDKKENKEQTANTNNEPAAQGPTDEGIKLHVPPAEGQNLDNTNEATKTVSEETHPPDPSDPDRSQDKPEKNIDPNEGDEGTKSVNPGTEGQGLKDGGGQQQDTAGSGANTILNEDGNKERIQTAGQSPNKGGIQENDPPVKHDEDTPRPPERGGHQEKSGDSKAGGGDKTPTEDTHDTTSQETEVQSPDKTDEDKTNDLKRAEDTEAEEKSTLHPAEGKGHQRTTPDSGDGEDNTTPQSPADRPPDHVKEADGQNDKQTSSDQTTGERQEDERKTGEENSSVSNKTGSSAKTGTSV